MKLIKGSFMESLKVSVVYGSLMVAMLSFSQAGVAQTPQQASKKWSMPIRNWTSALNRFMIMFDERVSKHLI